MFRLLRYFSITSLIGFIASAAVLGFIFRQAALADLTQLEQDKTSALAQMLANSLWPEFAPFAGSASGHSGDELRATPEIAALQQAVTAQTAGLSVLKVKIYNLDGLTVFSTDARQIGEDKRTNAGFLSARTGVAISQLTHHDTFSSFEGVVEDRDLLSTYIPIRRSNAAAPIEGVFEIYTDVTVLLARMERIQVEIAVAVTLILSGLYLILFLIVRRGDGILRRQHVEYQLAKDDLQKAHGELEHEVNKRTAQLRASAEVGRAAASILDADQLLSEIVHLITDRFGYYYAAVFTLDDDSRFAVLREATGEAGGALKDSGHRLEVGGQSMVGSAVAQRTARIAGNIDKETVRFDNPMLPYTRAEIVLPLMIGERVLGALDVQATQENAFDEASAAALQSMADQIAIALNNAELFHRVETQAQVQADLNRISRGLLSATNAEMLYRTLASQLGMIAPHDRISIALHESEGPTLRDYELHANADPVAGEAITRTTINTLAGRAFATHKSAISADTSQDTQALIDVAALAQEGFRSVLCVPLTLGGRLLGTLNLASRQPVAFPADVIAPVEQVAAQVAVALENVRLVAAQQRSVQELEVLTRQLTAKAWAEEFKRLPEGMHNIHVARGGVQPAEQTWLPEMELAVAAMKPVAWSQRKEQTISSPYQAAMAAPIVLRGEVIGALQVGEEGEPRSWSADDLTFIQSVADQVALAVENARLIDETQRAAQREKTIAEAADRIHRPIELDSILRAAVEEVQRITGASNVGIQLGIPLGGHAGHEHPSPEELLA